MKRTIHQLSGQASHKQLQIARSMTSPTSSLIQQIQTWPWGCEIIQVNHPALDCMCVQVKMLVVIVCVQALEINEYFLSLALHVSLHLKLQIFPLVPHCFARPSQAKPSIVGQEPMPNPTILPLLD